MPGATTRQTICLAACKETDHKEVFHWVVKSSPRIWHGRLLKSAWKDLGEGAWTPKASARPRAVHCKASGPAPQSQQSGEDVHSFGVDVYSTLVWVCACMPFI